MSVSKRKTSAGYTAEYHYAFSHDGKRYRGVCKNCTTKKQAEFFEREMMETVNKAAQQKSVRALVENFRDELSGGSPISIVEAYDLSLKKPRKRIASAKQLEAKRAYWNDFAAFMMGNYPDAVNLADVKPSHAESYIQHLRQGGRFNKTISYSGDTIKAIRSYDLRDRLSPRTINVYQQSLSTVFSLLARDAGVIDNPFSTIQKLDNEYEQREAFSEAELQTIRDHLDDFTRPLFTIAIATALREGDICTLKWTDIDFAAELIVKRMRKTGKFVEIPIMPPLKGYLVELKSQLAPTEEYVLPKHAAMYLANASGISYRIKLFLEKTCGITTNRIPPGRSRSVSVKDLHSCRHTFCYYAGLYGIPLSIVQSIVGHMTPEMTKHYSAHATLEAKREKMKQLPSFMMLTNPEVAPSIDRVAIIRRIETASEDQLREIMDILG